jgi:calcium/proton exchanger cax
MGFSMLLGGLRYKEQTFQPIVARVNADSMNLAVIAMLMPTAMNYTSQGINEQTLQIFYCCCCSVNPGLCPNTVIFDENPLLSL